DPFFFDISPREAIEMNPAQKLTLEIVWEALEHAGIPYKNLEGSHTGVFMGSVWNDFERIRIKKQATINQHSAVGQSLNIIANRVSYAFGFQGPSIVVDSACSSSLLSVHLACQSLQTGDSDLAIAGGVNLMLDPETYVALSKFGGLCADGKCKTFDEKANGYVRGEGAGVVVLKRLSEAKRDGDKILAVVKGSAVNNDGYSNGLTAPNLEAQKAVLKDACRRAGIAPSSVNYVEAHGTGTKLGDPIEVEALASVLTQDRKESEPLRIGSVKTNIGHLEGAAGIAGIIKSILILQNRVIPKSINFDTPNPFIPFEDYNIQVQTENEPIQLSKYKKFRIGVSAFGWGGTNCHVSLEEYPEESNELFVYSDDSDLDMLASLRELKNTLKRQSYTTSLKNLCAEYASANEDNNKAHRIAFKVSSFRQFDKKLSGIIASQGEKYYEKVSSKKKKLVYVLSPYGGQYPNMGLKLLKNESVFRKKMELCDQVFMRHAGWSLIQKLKNVTEAELEDMSINIPLSYAIQISLHELYKSWGIKPDFVLGHSMGEIAAAHISGILSLEDATRVVYHYSRLLQETAGDLGMAVVNYPKDMVEQLLENYPSIEIAGYNAPNSTNIAGDKPSIDKLLKEIRNRGGKAVKINIHVAAHTSYIKPIMDEMDRSIGHIEAMEPIIPMISTSTDESVVEPSAMTTKYWSNNLRYPVNFYPAIEKLLEENTVFLELSVHPVLRYYLNSTFVAHKINALALYSLEKEKEDVIACQNLLASLYLEGYDINWSKIYSKYHNSLINKKSIIQEDEPYVLTMSAKSEFSLKKYTEDYIHFIKEQVHSQKELFDMCCTAAIRRSHFGMRLAVVGKNKEEFIEQLQFIAEDEYFETPENYFQSEGKLVFVFPGQGSQWIGMGQELYKKEEVFREAIQLCDRTLNKYVDWSLIDVINNPEERHFKEIDIIQPSIFAMQVALAELWMSWGVMPHAVIGHSMGEVASAYISGAISLEDAALIISQRSKMMKQVSGKGAMLMTDLTVDEANELKGKLTREISVAVNNSPKSSVLAGDHDLIHELQVQLESEGRFARTVKVDVASHSHHMDAVSLELRDQLERVQARESAIPMYSTVLKGKKLSGEEMTKDYWVKNLRNTVQFATAIESLAQDEHAVFIEVSPHPVLTRAIEENLDAVGKEGIAIPSLLRNKPEQEVIIKHLGDLYCAGYNPNWRDFYPSASMLVELPVYPWYREQFQIEDKSEEFNPYFQKSPLLGRKIRIADSKQNHYWEVNLSTNRFPFLKDHLIEGKNMLPVSCYIEMIHEAVNELFDGNETFAIGNPHFTKRIEIFDEKPVQLQMKVKVMQPELLAFNFYYLAENATEWVECASCMVKNLLDEDEVEDAEYIDVDIARREEAREIIAPVEFYDFYKRLNINYGNYFQCVSKIVSKDEHLFLKLTPDHRVVKSSGRYGIHPTVMDGCFQAVLLAIPEHKKGVGFKIDSIRKISFLRKPDYGAPIWVHIKTRRPYDEEKKHLIADIILFTDDNKVICTIKRLKLTEFDYSASSSKENEIIENTRLRAVSDSVGTSTATLQPSKKEEEKSEVLTKKVQVASLEVKEIEDILRSRVASFIKANKSRVGLKQDFKSLGIDSLMVMKLKVIIEQEFGVAIQTTAFWTYANIKQFAKFLAKELGEQQPLAIQHERIKVAEEVTSTIEADVAQLGVDELLAELEKELATLS
ncbi:MAG: acyltransferase domain-containing protein, partial [Flammeovirgaceae bacterium]